MSLAELVRRRALSLPVQPTPSRIDGRLLAELNRIGVNVNQLARSINTDREFRGDWRAIKEELTRLLAAVSRAYDSEDPR
ncbi:MAG: plasmid mobilization relaxosome protein MobC [Pirellulales bacterium]